MPGPAFLFFAFLLAIGCGCDKSPSPQANSHDAATSADAAVADAGAADTDAATKSSAGATEPGTDVEPCVPSELASDAAPRCGVGGPAGAPECEQWAKVEPAGTACSDGSQYKFFVNLTNDSPNLLIMFEPGGACWDYASCSGTLRGAANPNGIPDDHMAEIQYLNLLRRTADNPLRDWNLVFLPYCTGDVFGGNEIATYEDPDGGPALTYGHLGYPNTLAVLDWIAERFDVVPQLLVTGCSAGGIAAQQHYALIRDRLPGAECGYLLNDSGPALHSTGAAAPLHETVRVAWNQAPLLDELSELLNVPVSAFEADNGTLNLALADAFPRDRLALSVYQQDLNFSLYTYERFYPGETPDDYLTRWHEDLQVVLDEFDTRANLAYFVPVYRTDNCSHCLSIPPLDHDLTTVLQQPWLGTDIAAENIDLFDFVEVLIDDTTSLTSYREPPSNGEGLSDDEAAACLDPALRQNE